MSVVWRAHDARLEREVAVKLLRPFVAGEPDRRSRLAREARTLAALSNDHIVRVYDYAEAGEDAVPRDGVHRGLQPGARDLPSAPCALERGGLVRAAGL